MPRKKSEKKEVEKNEYGKRTSKINTWVMTERSKIVDRDGKNLVCYFDKALKQPKLSIYNKFFFRKTSYENQLDLIVRYINFFIANYDSDNELIIAYLKIKYAIDEQGLFTEANMDSYISFLYQVIFTDSIIEKITKLVEDNYLDDIEKEDEKRRKYKNSGKHLESLEFTNQHIKILLRISFGMKLLAAPMLHFHAVNTIKIVKDSDNIFRFFRHLFDIFGIVKKSTDVAFISTDGKTYYVYNETTKYYDRYDNSTNRLNLPNVAERKMREATTDPETGVVRCEPREYIAEYNMYNKLFVYVKTKVNENYANNSAIYGQREIFGIDLFGVIQSFLHSVLISENMIKYKFNEHWDPAQKKYKENIIGFNKTVIKYQLMYFLKEQYSKNLTEVTNTKTPDGLSGGDKMAMNLSKIDEGVVVMAEISIPITIEYLKKEFGITIEKKELDFYVENHCPDKIQIELIKSYFAKYFGSMRVLSLMTRVQYITLMLLLKKKLLSDLGYDESSTRLHPAALPYFISANLEDQINTRVIRNINFREKVESAYTYRELQNGSHWYLNFIRPNYDVQLISSLINTRYTYVEYKHPELLGTVIEYSEDKIADELLFFLSSMSI